MSPEDEADGKLSNPKLIAALPDGRVVLTVA